MFFHFPEQLCYKGKTTIEKFEGKHVCLAALQICSLTFTQAEGGKIYKLNV